MSVTAADRPRFSPQDARRFIGAHYRLTTSQARPLAGGNDQNFLLETEVGTRVLKISNPGESLAVLDLQNRLLAHLGRRLGAPWWLPRVYPAQDGKSFAITSDEHGNSYLLRLLDYLPGVPLAEVNPQTPELLNGVGRLLARVDRALLDFKHPAMRRRLPWDLENAAAVIRRYRRYLPPSRRRFVEEVLAAFDAGVAPVLSKLRRSVIHNDANDYNLLIQVQEDIPGTASERETISGLIDFGDVVYTRTLFEPAIACAYAMLGKSEPLAAAAHLVAGYHAVLPLDEQELDLLFTLIRARLGVSVCLCAYQRRQDPHNSYHTISEKPAWALLERLRETPPALARYRFRRACGLEPSDDGRSGDDG